MARPSGMHSRGACSLPGRPCSGFATVSKAVGAAPEIDELCLHADLEPGVLFIPALTGLGAATLGSRRRAGPSLA